MSLYFIFLVGCPGSGKSTLAQQIISISFTKFEFSTDLFALKEIFVINDIMIDIIQNRRSAEEIENSFLHLLHTTIFWKDLLEERIKHLQRGEIRIDQLETERTKDGGYRILKPRLWDEALYRSIGLLKSDKCYLFEFSRGRDQKYMQEFKISSEEIYLRCFTLIFHANPRVTANNSLIIHISASRAERERRNQNRKILGEPYVSHQVMEEVYGCDVFSFEKDAKLSLLDGFLSPRLPIPVISIDNTLPNPAQNFAGVINHIEIIVQSLTNWFRL